MGACRMGYRLTTIMGWRNLWSSLRYKPARRSVRTYVFRDTLTPIICWLSGGHEFYWQPDPVNEPEEVLCNWCHHRRGHDGDLSGEQP